MPCTQSQALGETSVLTSPTGLWLQAPYGVWDVYQVRTPQLLGEAMLRMTHPQDWLRARISSKERRRTCASAITLFCMSAEKLGWWGLRARRLGLREPNRVWRRRQSQFLATARPRTCGFLLGARLRTSQDRGEVLPDAGVSTLAICANQVSRPDSQSSQSLRRTHEHRK